MASLLSLFRPTWDAIFGTIPFKYRWRLLAFQPLNTLVHLIHLPGILSRRHTSLSIPVRNDRTVRAIMFEPPNRTSDERLRPIHLDIHAGGFVGGFPEANARFCSTLSDRTGAVVVSCTYRFAPRHPYPAAAEDIEDVIQWLLTHAESTFKADPKLLTIGGASAGGTLALSACQQPDFRGMIKGSVTFYAPVDLRISPDQKPRPPQFPSFDPMFWMLPLFYSYASLAEPPSENDPRLHPILADLSSFPEDMLFIIPAIDIVVHEQLMLVERLKTEIQNLGEEGKLRRVETVVFDKCFHGWLELPSFAIKESSRQAAFDASCRFIAGIHKKHGFELKNVRA